MNYRKLDFNKIIYGEIRTAFLFLERLLEDIKELLKSYGDDISEEEKEDVIATREKIEQTLEKYKIGASRLEKVISNELLNPEYEEYLIKYKKFPPGASKTFEEFSRDMDMCFELEDVIASGVVTRIWQNETSKETDLKRHQPFMSVVHSGRGMINLPGTKHYRATEYNNQSYISCSLLTDKHMDMYNDAVGIEFFIDQEVMICANEFDCATRYSDYPSIYSAKKVGDQYVESGYTHSYPTTRLVTPKMIERRCLDKAENFNMEPLNGKNKIINEIVLDKALARPKSIVMQTSGCSFDFYEFITAKRMEEVYGVPLKVINRSGYRKELGFEPFSQDEKTTFYNQYCCLLDMENVNYVNEQEKQKARYCKEFLNGMLPTEQIAFLTAYEKEVVEAGGFDDRVKACMQQAFGYLKEKARNKQREMNRKVIRDKPPEDYDTI